MSRTIAATKFIGVASLGLLTGISLTTPLLTLPSLLHLPSAPLSHTSFTHYTYLLRTTTLPLSTISSLSLLTSYLLSPSYHRHPYLLLTAALPLLSITYDFTFLRPKQKKMERLVKDNGEMGVNGEELRREMVGWGRRCWGVMGLVGCGFGMGIVGIWGDCS